jgi:hypothetical protein
MDKQYNLVLKPNEIEENVIKKEDSSIAYIIYQNNKLIEKYEEIKGDNEKLKVQYNELEEDLERMEKSKIFLQGLCKNTNIIKKNQSTIIDTFRFTNRLLFGYIIFIHIFSLGFSMISFFYNQNAPMLFSILQLSTTSTIVCGFMYNSDVQMKVDKLQSAKDEIVLIETATDHINDIIDDS